MRFILPALFCLLVANIAFGGGRARSNLEVIRNYEAWHFVSNALVIGLVAAASYWLIHNVPFFDQNPINWAFSKMFGASDDGSTDSGFLLSQWKWYALLYLPVLLYAVPTFTRSAEEKYREGTRDWGHGLIRSIRFGLAYLFLLVPIGVAIAVSIAGLWFTYQYFQGGIERSTTHHAVFNSILGAAVYISLFY